ncbi:hypothetical protein GCM10025865_08790 [Paraoerskovia sediminicola]|uniref:N-acetyltransferase domain-containing protein n=2 Tax=Paraoerskovia sediminicola TaxID=1138587 RepID=A0ABM8G0Z5_9CELL|nr:hypothetical protein GCM10025865_08790 [Paraoerskovia sediminicola]
MAALEARAVDHGLDRLVLETGVRQPQAIGLYLALGYAPIARYGAYIDSTESRCFAKDLHDPPPNRGSGAMSAPGSHLETGSAAGGAGSAGPRTADLRPAGSRTADRQSAAVATSLPAPIVVTEVPWGDPDAFLLRREMFETTNLARYPEDFGHLVEPGAFEASDAALGESAIVTLVARRGDRLLGCASVRGADAGSPAGAAELSKVFVRDEARRTGVASALLDAIEAAARAHGVERLLLGTGPRQPEALATYRRRGYRPVLPFPPYDAFDSAFCLGLDL